MSTSNEEVLECENCDWMGFESDAAKKRVLRIKICPECGDGVKVASEIDAMSFRTEDSDDANDTEAEDGVLSPRPDVEDEDDEWDWNPTIRAGHDGPELNRDCDRGYHNKGKQRERSVND